MDENRILESLQAATTPHEQAAIIAESAFHRLQPAVADTIRQCAALPWFTDRVIKALSLSNSREIIVETKAIIVALPFVEAVPWGGYTFHDLTRQGLLTYYCESRPETIITACQKAASVFLNDSSSSNEAALAALYCLLVGAQTELAQEFLYETLFRLAKQEDWKGVEALYRTVDEAVALPITPPLPPRVTQELTQDRKNLAAAFYNRGNTYVKDGDIETAITNYSRAITLAGDNVQIVAQAYNNRGIAFDLQARFDEAVANYDLALTTQLNDKDFVAQVYNNRGITYLKKGLLDYALKDFNYAIATSDSIAAEAYRNRGLVYKVRGEHDEYQADLKVATCWHENQLGQTTYSRGNVEQAVRHYENAVKLSREIGSLRVLRISLLNLALLHREQGNLTEALELFTEIVEIDEKAGFPDLEKDRQILQGIRAELKRD